LAIFGQTAWANHPDTAHCMKNLAILYERQGKIELAEPLYLRALTIREQALGSDYSERVSNYAELLQKCHREEQAAVLETRIKVAKQSSEEKTLD